MEEFRKVEGYDNYSVSNYGRIRNDVTQKILNPSILNSGYHYVDLWKDGKRKRFNIHRLVASAFIDNPDNKTCVDHIDNDKLNNHRENLRWVTLNENQMNKSMCKNNTSGIKGVCFNKKAKKWQASIMINGKNTYIGCYNTLEEAAEARRRVAEQNFGDYLNACEKVQIIINPQQVIINN